MNGKDFTQFAKEIAFEVLQAQQAMHKNNSGPAAHRGRPTRDRKTLPLRVPATLAFYEAALCLPREGSGFSAAMWARSRLTMTLLRFFGLRASEAALVKLNDLNLIREGHVTELDIMQPKTGRFRKVVVSEGLVQVLNGELASDLSTLLLVAGGDGTRCLGSSVKGKSRGRQFEEKTRLGHVIEPLPEVRV